MPRYALLDACVLATFPVADLILRLAEENNRWTPIWSADILDEVHRTHRTKLAWPKELADSFRNALESEFAESMVTGYQDLIPSLTNDFIDRHVLAAAIKGEAEVLTTFNLRDFPRSHLGSWGIRAAHPQDHLIERHREDAHQFEACMSEIMRVRKQKSRRSYLTGLSRYVPTFVRYVLDRADNT